MLTYNQILKRIKTVALSHSQVKNFYKGLVTDFLTDKKTNYTSVFLQNEGGSVSISNKVRTTRFKLFVLDLVNIDDETNDNLDDVQSDCLSIAEDLISLLDDNKFSDWALETENSYDFLQEKFDDMIAGVSIDITIRTPFSSDKCGVPLN